ncbi:hypothetical protein FQV37_2220 [Psychrobacter nivimaris]|uniref:Uncharacterized protein n=1 Tax=Psychrobacter nivimaris TaxID=281738 RepID=A0A6N7BWV2_9GAMM|nr:hypothetical protein [Psychrobacter nivimaris]KAF0567443.1 hypothetical protein FQV37_2220 [Psychrobacter nivimaris]
MKKTLKWVGIFFAVIFIIGIIAAIFETDEQAAARELDTKNKEVAAEQVKAEKLQAKADKQAAKDKAEVVDDGRMSKIELYVECQVKVQNSLKNPRSFDPERRSLKYLVKENGNQLIGFDFYAENSFGGEEIHQAVCEFDKNDKIVSAGYK